MNKTLDEMKMIHEEEMQSYGRIQDRVISVMLPPMSIWVWVTLKGGLMFRA